MLYLAEKTACIATHSAISPAQAGKVWKPHSFGRGVEVASKPFPFAHLKKGNPTVRRAAPVEWIHHWKESCPANQPGSLPLLLPEKGEEKHPKRYPKNIPVKQLPLPLSAPRPVTALPYSVRGSKGWVGNGLSGERFRNGLAVCLKSQEYALSPGELKDGFLYPFLLEVPRASEA